MQRETRLRGWIALLFFVSGGCALVYEIVWSTMLHHVFGSSVLATAAVLAAYMGGLALGSFLFGKRADSYSHPLRLYAWLEICIGLFALAFPFILPAGQGLYVWIHAKLYASSYLVFNLIRLCIAFVIILVPTSLMGGTLPVMSRFVVRRLETSGSIIGILYGVNTLGAVVGCAVAGFWAIAVAGAKQTSFAAAALNVAIGLAVLAVAKEWEKQCEAPRRDTAASAGQEPHGQAQCPDHVQPLLLVVAISGFCALAYEVLWSRILVFFVMTNVYAFPLMLTVFLCGSSLGTLLITLRLARRGRVGLQTLSVLQIAIGAAAIASVALIPTIKSVVYGVSPATHSSYASFLVGGFCAAGILIFVPTFFIGMVIPVVAALCSRALPRMGSTIGAVYGANTLGAIAGSVAAGLVIIPTLGIVNGIVVCSLLNIAAGLAVLFADPRASWRTRALLVAAPVAYAVVMAVWFVPWGRPIVLYSRFFHALTLNDRTLYYKEGLGATVTVTEFGPFGYHGTFAKSIEVNGVSVAGTTDMLRMTQKVQGHFPLILYRACTGRDPRHAFILGLGTGESSHCITRHDIVRLDCLELASAELGANHLFSEINHDILKEPKFKLTIDDARNFLLATSTRYDVIESDAVHPDVDISTYTKEYFEICRDRLTDQGIFSTWIPFFSLNDANLKVLMRTLHSVFPHVMIWYVPYARSKHAILMGMKERPSINVRFLEEGMREPAVEASLAEIHIDDEYDFLCSFACDEKSSGAHLGAGPVNDDNRLHLPYNIPRQARQGEETVAFNLMTLYRMRTDIRPYLTGLDETAGFSLDTLARRTEARYRAMQGLAASYDDNLGDALEWYRSALHIDSANVNLRKLYDTDLAQFLADRGFAAIRAGRFQEGVNLVEQAAAADTSSLVMRNWIGMACIRANMLDRAQQVLDSLLATAPRYIEARWNLAEVYFKKGQVEKARDTAREILRDNPNCSRARLAENAGETKRGLSFECERYAPEARVKISTGNRMLSRRKNIADESARRIAQLEDKLSRREAVVANLKKELEKYNPTRVERDIFCELSKNFAKADTFDALFKRTLEILSHHLKARYYGVFWLTPDGEGFEFRHGKGYKPGLMSAIPFGGSLMGECLYHDTVLWEPNLRTKSDFIPLNQDPAEYNVLCAPLALLGKNTGVVRLANIDPASVEVGRRVLDDVTPLLVASLERLILFEKSERTRRGLETSFAIAKLLEDTLVDKDILKMLCREVPRLFRCAGCVIAVIDREKRPKPALVWPQSFCLGGNPGSNAVYLGNLLAAFPSGTGLIENIHTDRRWAWPDTKVKSLCMAPLRIRATLRGLVIAVGPADETYDSSYANLLGLAAAQTSMTLERAAYLRQQEDLARFDGLTGLFNHRVFQESVREEVERAVRYIRPLTLVMLDIDHFKKFNDTHGHPVGDEVLKMVGRTLKGFIRRTDRAFRYGGEEFCLLLPETVAANAAIIAERLRKKIELNRAVKNLAVTTSLGVAQLAEGEKAEGLIERCDKALYGSKEKGRNTVTVG